MAKTIIKIKTWRCECGYSQDFEPTQELLDLHFNNNPNFKLSNVKENECPACSLKGVRGKLLLKESNPDKKITMTVMGEEDIEPEIEQAIKGERKDIDVSTPTKENAYREKRKEDIRKAIIEAKRLEDK